MPEYLSDPGELPSPQASLATQRMLVQAFIKTVGKRRAEKYVRELAAIVANEESIRLMLPTRPQHERAAQTQAQREAAAWIRQMLPILLASIPPK